MQMGHAVSYKNCVVGTRDALDAQYRSPHGAHLRQNAGVNSTNTLNSSSRPNIMATVQTQV